MEFYSEREISQRERGLNLSVGERRPGQGGGCGLAAVPALWDWLRCRLGKRCQVVLDFVVLVWF